MRRKERESTREKTPDTDLYDKYKTNVVLCMTVDPSKTKEWGFYSNLCGHFLITYNKVNKYIYIIYLYYCNAILKTAMKNRS